MAHNPAMSADQPEPEPSDDGLIVTYPPFSTTGAAKAFGCGLCMGTADAVPGVSGGTIALILGIYELFIGCLADVVTVLRHPTDRKVWTRALAALRFLAPLGIGVVGAYLIATKLLVGALETPTDETWRALDAALAANPPSGWLVNAATAPIVFAFFFGLVVMSVHEPWREKASTKPIDWACLALGAVSAATLALSPPAAGSTSPVMLVGSGAIAISVMLLPGVSGSLALLVLGMYQIVSGAVHSREWLVIAWFLLGIAGGIAVFVPLLKKLLAVAHDRTMSVLSGLMLGSLAALWPWKVHFMPKFIPYKGPMSPTAPTGDWWWPVLAAIAGGAVIVTASRIANRPPKGV